MPGRNARRRLADRGEFGERERQHNTMPVEQPEVGAAGNFTPGQPVSAPICPGREEIETFIIQMSNICRHKSPSMVPC
jgi:hypothetical protein